MRSVLILGLSVGLLAGCGSKSSQFSSVDQCMESYAVYENFSKTASTFDKEKAKALVLANCEPVLMNDKAFEKMALWRFELEVPDHAQYKKTHVEVYYDDPNDMRQFAIVAFKKDDPEQKKKVFGAVFNSYDVKWVTRFEDLAADSPYQ